MNKTILNSIKKSGNKCKSNHAFTYVETILYMGLTAIIFSSLVSFAWNIITGSNKSSVQQEVVTAGRYVTERLKYEIRNAADINISTSNFDTNIATSGQLSLAETTSSINPTIFDISNGTLRIKQGTNAAVNLNSTDTKISSLIFTNFGSSDTKTKNIRFTITVQSVNNARTQYQETFTTESTVELRSN